MQWTVDEVFARYGDRIFAAAFSVCRNRADADDVVQDTLVRYYTHPREYESEDHLKAWLLRVAINRARDVSTSFWRKHTVAWEEYMNDLAFEEPQDSRLFEAVMRLPAKYRAVLHLFYYEGYAVAEIAHILHRPAGTVKSQLNRGRALLKTTLQEEWNDDE